jgi:hypothetical protein
MDKALKLLERAKGFEPSTNLGKVASLVRIISTVPRAGVRKDFEQFGEVWRWRDCVARVGDGHREHFVPTTTVANYCRYCRQSDNLSY